MRRVSAYASLVVPDFSKEPLSLSGLVLDFRPPSVGKALDTIADLIPAAPTTIREFGRADLVGVFLRISQGGKKPLVPVEVRTRIVDASDREVFGAVSTYAPDQFDSTRSREHRTDLPLSRLSAGAYLLTVEGSAGQLTVDRRVRFVVRP